MQVSLFKASAIAAAILGVGVFTLNMSAAYGFSDTAVYLFTGIPDGYLPIAGLVADSSGNLYGTTESGGANNWGCIYKLTPNGAGGYTETVLYSFTDGKDGAQPEEAALTLNGPLLYGTTAAGGLGPGVVFAYNVATGVLKPLHEFTGLSDGAQPDGGVVYDSGILFGTTVAGAAGYGVVYKINDGGTKFQVLHTFTGGADGDDPYCAPVKIGSLFYGETSGQGGTGSNGTVYYINSTGTIYGVLHNFDITDGEEPAGGRLIAIGQTLYGATFEGGTSGDGTIFSITTENSFASLYSFSGGDDGVNPFNSLVNGDNGSLYGTTSGGGDKGLGTVYVLKISTGHVSTLYSFTGGSRGSYPSTGSLCRVGGDIYGTTYFGGNPGLNGLGLGVVYRFPR